MKITRLFTGTDGKSHFDEIESEAETTRPLGTYSRRYSSSGFFFRDFEKDSFFDWHTAPRRQYIIYLEGKVEVCASGGEIKIFGPGDILLASDIEGEGHTTRTLTNGRSIIIVEESNPDNGQENTRRPKL